MSRFSFSKRQQLLFDGSRPSWDTLLSEQKHEIVEQLARLFLDYIGGPDPAANDSPRCAKEPCDAQEDHHGAS